jgi:DNA-binding IclR family transcriptional regulator
LDKKLAKEEDAGESQLVSALARGINILQCFTISDSELSAKNLIDRTGLPKPTVVRLINTLCEMGLLRYSERLSKYVLGSSLLSMGAPVLARMTIRHIARPLMQELADHCRGQVSLSVGDRFNMAFAEVVQGSKTSLYRPEVGTRMSLSRTASGRAYLLTLPPAQRAAYVANLRKTDAAKADALEERLGTSEHELRNFGYCTSHGDLQREVEVVAVPLSAPIDDEVWVFACSVSIFNLTGNQLVDDISPRLKALVRSVEAALGNVSDVAHYGGAV